MNLLFVFLCVLFTVSQYRCETPSCKTNCTTNEECWRDALAYRSWKLIEQFVSFSSLSVHVDTFQRNHPSEVNDSILFIDTALQNYLLYESIGSNLTMDLFLETKQILIDSCKNLTRTEIDTVEELPLLICSLSTCSSERMNYMVLLIISILVATSILVICIVQSFQTYRLARSRRIFPKSLLFFNKPPTSDSSLNIFSNRF